MIFSADDIGPTLETRTLEIRCKCGQLVEISMRKIQSKFSSTAYWKSNGEAYEKHTMDCKSFLPEYQKEGYK